MTHQSESVYTKLRPLLNADDLIGRLGLEEVRRIGDEIRLRPLCHESDSGESLHVNTSTGTWLCRACGFGGDLIQLTEYALSGGRAPSHGSAQTSSSAHRTAVEWLCSELGVPWRASSARSGDNALDALHAVGILAHRYLLDERPDVVEWIRDKWGFDRGVIEGYGIGFMPSPILPAVANWATETERAAMRLTGLGWVRDGRFHTRFEGRVTFPYLENGRAVYLIGRSTEWTPSLITEGRPPQQPPKYHKLTVHSEQRPHISMSISNDHLYLERVLSTAKHAVFVTEGVADAVALSSIGIDVVSPVTINFNARDLERFTTRCHEHGISTAVIIFDNELSGSGGEGAWRTAEKFVERGLRVKVLHLPLGPVQIAARDEVEEALGVRFGEFEDANPRRRKEILIEVVPNDVRREWVRQQIHTSKIDAAEWVRDHGAGSADELRALVEQEGIDVIQRAAGAGVLIGEDDPGVRAESMADAIALVACLPSPEHRAQYAGVIARMAGRGVTKAGISQRIAGVRRANRVEDAQVPEEVVELPPLVVDPPLISVGNLPEAPPVIHGSAPPVQRTEAQNDQRRFATWRENVRQHILARSSDDMIGQYCAGNIVSSLGYTPFKTPEGIYIVRMNRRIFIGSAQWKGLLRECFGLAYRKGAHTGAIEMTEMHVGIGAREVDDVAWSYVEGDTVYFPTGDDLGSIVKIEPDSTTLVQMSDVNVPAVAGPDFKPFRFTESTGGVAEIYNVLRWTSLPEGHRLLLVYWTVCLPILRRIGAVPIVRIEGGSSSGKTRAVEAIAQLVNGHKGSSVPSAAALASRMSVSMLTVDDNREKGDVTSAILSTLLQATHLGAKEKRRINSDTGTIVERISGALLMSGIEPIHDGRPELASRIVPLRCDSSLRASDSPESASKLLDAVQVHRDAFWSEAAELCGKALALDPVHGEALGRQIEDALGNTRMGRNSSYIRVMYLTWAAGFTGDALSARLLDLDPGWRQTLQTLGESVTRSLVDDEVACTSIRTIFAYGQQQSKRIDGLDIAFDGFYVRNPNTGVEWIGPTRITRLARLAREAAAKLGGPFSLLGIPASKLGARINDSVDLIESAGYRVSNETTNGGKVRWRFERDIEMPSDIATTEGLDTWSTP